MEHVNIKEKFPEAVPSVLLWNGCYLSVLAQSYYAVRYQIQINLLINLSSFEKPRGENAVKQTLEGSIQLKRSKQMDTTLLLLLILWQALRTIWKRVRTAVVAILRMVQDSLFLWLANRVLILHNPFSYKSWFFSDMLSRYTVLPTAGYSR